MDFLPESADKIAYIQEKVRAVFELWGFRRVITPLLEFQDVMDAGLGGELKERTFRFDDRQTGRLLAIPPDITPQIARIVATRMSSFPLPHRLYYSGRVLRHAESQSGRSRETMQAGVELIGLDSYEADAEMVAMAVEALKSLGLTESTVDIGQVEFFRGILDAAPLETGLLAQLREAIAKKDSSAVAAILEQAPVADTVKEQIAALPRLFGGREVLDQARRIATSDRSRRALDMLEQVLKMLDVYGVSEHVVIDLGEIRGLDYYTGLTFEGFVRGIGEPVCGGGRYDGLTARYGFPAPATGFAFNIMALLSALERQPDVVASTTRDFLLFNMKEDRRDALEIAKGIRAKGFTVSRDIIRRGLTDSLDYARRNDIRYVVVVGDERCSVDETVLIRVADRQERLVSKDALLAMQAPEDFHTR
jgi:ATP phosphoribosyltransferase regulatory subunit